MTTAQLRKLCIKLLDNNELYVRYAGIVRSLEKIAENAFTNDTPNNDDLKIVREQLLYLRDHARLKVDK